MYCRLSFLPATKSTAMGVTAEIYGWGRVEASERSLSEEWKLFHVL